MINLEGKTILVTGASSGIGKSVAVLLSQLGATLVITGRDIERLEKCYHELSGEHHLMILADLIVDSGQADVVAGILQLDGAVFCAGVIDYQPVKFLTKQKIEKIFSINFDSPVLLTQKLLKGKKINKGSSLVYISSLSSKLGVGGTALYAASKAALSGFSKVLATELAGQKIRVNAVSPGIIKTPMVDDAELAVSKDTFDESEKNYPLGYGAPSDVSSYIAFLLSDSSGWITGTDQIIDGGFTLN